MRHFCTYFDTNYFVRGLALYESLHRHCPTFTLWVLCLDRESLEQLQQRALPHVELISLDDLERETEGLADARANRSIVEYYFTCSPALPLFILNTEARVELITYLDSDLYFYSDPEPVFEQLGSGSVGIVRHRVGPLLAFVEQYGIFNVGWISFRRDAAGMECLSWWRDRCLEWCYQRLENQRYADQKYLDEFPHRFRNVVTLEHKGANLAPWNIGNYHIRSTGGRVMVDDQALVCFHFHGFTQITRLSFTTGLGIYKVRTRHSVLRMIFEPYIKTLLTIAPGNNIAPDNNIDHRRRRERASDSPAWRRLLRPLMWSWRTMSEHFNGVRIVFLAGRVL